MTVRIGRYRVIGPLGKGGQGEVVEAERSEPDGTVRRVALKLLAGDAHGLRREARMTALLRHPHLVDVYEIGVDDSQEAIPVAFCAMELCERSLSGCGILPPKAVVEVGLQICSALSYAFEALELVHLDLKPANLLLQRGVVKVADLGISAARGFRREVIGGTPRYMAPEQRLVDPVDARADVFALGRVLERLAGTVDPTDAVTLPAGQAMPIGNTAAAWVADVVARCTEFDPDDRYPSMEAVAAALRALDVDGPGLAEFMGTEPATETPQAPIRGRSQMLRDLHRRLARPALLTLKGPAGIGKSRLANALVQTWDAGPAWFVELGSEDDAPAIARRVASVLDVRLASETDPVRQLGRALHSRGRALLVLDGVEPVIQALAVIPLWRQAAPELRVVLTSRLVTQLPDEDVLEVPHLSPGSAMALLRDRAAERGVFDPDAAALQAIAQRLDGLPLALELAAGRLGVLSANEVLARLDLTLLRSGVQGLGPRQATLQGALDWSWELLEPQERTVFTQLSVFRGSFDAAAASAVVEVQADLEGVLATLHQHSLLRWEDGRGKLLEVVRAYAALELSASTPSVQERHARWYGRLGALDPTPAARDEAERELDNLTAAVEAATHLRAWTPARGAARAAAWVLQERGPISEAERLLSVVIDAGPDEIISPLLVHRAVVHVRSASLADAEADLSLATDLGVALHEQGDLALARGELHLSREAWPPAIAAFEEALAALELEGRFTAWACLGAGRGHLTVRAREQARPLLERACKEFRDAGHPAGEAMALGLLGILARQQGDNERARSFYDAAIAIERTHGLRLALAHDWTSLAVLLTSEGAGEGAWSVFVSALQIVRAGGFRQREAVQLSFLAEAGLRLGHPDEALRSARECLAIHRETGNQKLEDMISAILAEILWFRGDRDEALALWLAAEARGEVIASMQLGLRDVAVGHADQGATRLQRAVDGMQEGTTTWRWAVVALAEAQALQGIHPDREQIAQHVEKLLIIQPWYGMHAACAAFRTLREPAFLEMAEALARKRGFSADTPMMHDLHATRSTLQDRVQRG